MVSSISSSNDYSLREVFSKINDITNTSVINCEELFSSINHTDSENSNTIITDSEEISKSLIPTFPTSFNSKKDLFNACSLTHVSKMEDFVKNCQVTNNLDSDDYDSLYKEYMDYRGCKNTDELEALSSVYDVCSTTVDDLRTSAKWALATATSQVELATRKNNNIGSGVNLDGDLASDILSSANVENLANFVNGCNDLQSSPFTEQVLNLQTFFSNVSSQNNVDSELKGEISNYSQNIVNSADKIIKYTIQSEKYLGRYESNIMSTEAYRALLINKYQT